MEKTGHRLARKAARTHRSSRTITIRCARRSSTIAASDGVWQEQKHAESGDMGAWRGGAAYRYAPATSAFDQAVPLARVSKRVTRTSDRSARRQAGWRRSRNLHETRKRWKKPVSPLPMSTFLALLHERRGAVKEKAIAVPGAATIPSAPARRAAAMSMRARISKRWKCRWTKR